MKFELGDHIDNALTTTIAHEYSRAKECFDMFAANETYRITKKDESKLVKIRSYNLYSDFLAHLYEFYVGCIKRDRKSLKDLPSEMCDKLLVHEAQKMMNLAADQIERGIAPSWENDLSCYKVTIPSDFGKHFRAIRNLRNHVDPKRATGEVITLTDFYTKYHFFIYKLYSYPSWMWGIKNIDAYDLKDIENFCTAVIN